MPALIILGVVAIGAAVGVAYIVKILDRLISVQEQETKVPCRLGVIRDVLIGVERNCSTHGYIFYFQRAGRVKLCYMPSTNGVVRPKIDSEQFYALLGTVVLVSFDADAFVTIIKTVPANDHD